MAHRWPQAAAVCWVLLGAAQAQAQTQAQAGPAGPAGTGAQDPATMERAQREADGPRRRILEAAKAKEKAPAAAVVAAKAVDAAAPRPKAVPPALATPAGAVVTAATAAPASMPSPLALNTTFQPRPDAQPAPTASPAPDPQAESPAPEPQRTPAAAESPALSPPPAPAVPVVAALPAVAAQPPPSQTEPSPGELAYAAELNRLVDSLKRYPTSREARSLRPQGTVQVWLDIDRQGLLLQAGLQAPSGAPLLDGEALRSLRQGRYPAFPAGAFEGAASRRFVLAIEYRSDGN